MAEEKVLITGNEAAAEAAIQAGCRFYYGYPITPQNEVPAYMAVRMPQVGGTFIQAESELAAVSMVMGTAATGKRAMTSSSSPGISLKQEGISYMAGAELPGVIMNVMRGGPGLGDISPAQSDYFQAVKGGGHGDYRLIVLAPHTVQEMYDLVMLAFDLADKYRNPAMILSDGLLGQMMEPCILRQYKPIALPAKDGWQLTGAKGRERHIVRSFFLIQGFLVGHNERLQAKYREVEAQEVRYEESQTEDAQVILVAYGTSARVCLEAMRIARRQGGVRMGLIRPITLWPFPTEIIRQRAASAKPFLAVEMSAGQMVEDVRLAVEGRAPVGFVGRVGGGVPETDEVIKKAEELVATRAKQ
jgi:2-oxoglutarate/2-oxoacid ferredoxin oxidoreductase subunit alpha